ncbi:hypothetical protein DXH95_10940 [Sphingorhabdus pulchriflava]|uniref:Lipoprotein n=1 Tax=Sphingorhabdus pulchriflava TaxID=2292257 RepID=A0A371B4P2_9SPHN|nr:hypothetical protein [Sphingorhabdus pulchriflava]RDV02487.1 hypothetical protein DXH95_10940 [Sphingorhabdus pulchriflava]
MLRLALSLFIAILGGCSDLGGFEQDLDGAEARAWKLCEERFDGRVYSAPVYGETNDQHILFSWNIDEAEREGGPLFCRTNAEGTNLIEMQMSRTATDESK